MHYARDCRTNRRNNSISWNRSVGSGRNKSSWPCLTATYDKAAWYIDSGATAHMTSCRELVSDVQEASSATVTVANDMNWKLVGAGKVKLQTLSSYVTKKMCMLFLIFAPTYARGLRVEFDQMGCRINNQNGFVVGTAKNRNGLWKAGDNANTKQFSCKKHNKSSILWHRRFWHVCPEKLNR